MNLNRVDVQHKRRIVNVDGNLVLSQILDGREEYVTEIHARTEMFSKPEIRDIFLYEEGSLNGFDARISQRVFVVGRIEREPDSSLVSITLDSDFKKKYAAAQNEYAGKKDDALPKPSIMLHAKAKGDTLELHVKNLAKEDVVPLHKDDIIVYREGILTVEDASGEETHESFGVYALKSEKDSLVLD
ncbi:hypothetical protein KY338_02945 [Candidatus Woesearchaeota archaeon]|nr:hypothetical protein [Candidatus Woesearchaeota archaeon]MBW3005687.1 hypothetical protein [Candidatus Woesearchaeota archaeon]